jgi:thiol-disulfide isomerase/thioredoxin
MRTWPIDRRSFLAALVLAGLGWPTLCVAAPASLTLPDLVNRPDRWPAEVTVTRDFIFNASAAVHTGDKAKVVQFDGTKVLLIAANNIRFTATPSDAGLLAAANQAWSALTPAQREIAPDTLAADPSLWPIRLKIISPIICNWGKLPPGTEVALNSVSTKGLEIGWPNSPNRLNISFDSTDIFDRSRRLVLLDRPERPSRLAAALHGLLVDSDGKPFDESSLAGKQIFALYFGAGWCAPCHAFSPDLVKYLTTAWPRHPELAVVFMSNDKQVAPMLEYMKEEKMVFPAVPPGVLVQSPFLMKFAAQMIPQLIIVDRFGNVLASNDDHRGNRGDPNETIAALDGLLALAR